MIGKWNKSVILSYIGLAISILGIFLIYKGIETKYVLICLMVAGICDLFDGTVARRCKRTEEEKLFGVELDSLIDVVNFLVFPVIILLSLGINSWYSILVYILYILFGVARLAFFNITTEDMNKPRKYYEGLPVTYAALLFPIIYLLSYLLKQDIFNLIYLLSAFIISILFIIRVKIPKPRLVSSLLLIVVAIIITVVYIIL